MICMRRASEKGHLDIVTVLVEEYNASPSGAPTLSNDDDQPRPPINAACIR